MRQEKSALARKGSFEAVVRRRVTGEETGKCVGISEDRNALVGGPRQKPTLSGEAETNKSPGQGVQKDKDGA